MPHVPTEQLPLLAGVALGAGVLLVMALPLIRDPASVAALEASPAVSGEPTLADAGAPTARDDAPTDPVPFRDKDAAEGPDKPPADLSADELAAATSVEQLKRLAREHPSDERVFAKLARAHAASPDGLPGALSTLKTLFSGSPKAREDKELQAIVTRAASGPPAVQEPALALLSTGMGSVGPDLLYELAVATSVAKPLKQKALDLTKREDVRKLASPALLVALELRDHPSCARNEYLVQAEKSGDQRSLGYLTPLLATKGCGLFGLSDCYACANRAGVNRAIQAINGRVGK